MTSCLSYVIGCSEYLIFTLAESSVVTLVSGQTSRARTVRKILHVIASRPNGSTALFDAVVHLVSCSVVIFSENRWPQGSLNSILQVLGSQVKRFWTLSLKILKDPAFCRQLRWRESMTPINIKGSIKTQPVTTHVSLKLTVYWQWECTVHCVQKKTPTHIFFHISMNYLWI